MNRLSMVPFRSCRAVGRVVSCFVGDSDLLLLLRLAAQDGTPRSSAGCGSNVPLAAGGSESFHHQGRRARTASTASTCPKATIRSGPLLWCWSSTATPGLLMKIENEYTSFSQHADEHGYVVVLSPGRLDSRPVVS